MINGHISLESAKCELVETKVLRLVDGLPTEETLKFLKIWDPESHFEFRLQFTNGEHAAFVRSAKGEDE